QELFPYVFTRKGMVFSRKALTQTSKNITDRLGNEGYAFANVNAIPDIDEDKHTAAITYFVDPGQRVYVRRVNFFGNAKTRDEVMRRELRQMEGGWISTARIERSKVRLRRLGYFEDVSVETPAVPGTTDQVDVNFTVKERPSGNLLLGLGFSQSAGLIFNTNVTQDNFLGSGKSVSFGFNNSEINRTFRLGYLNPYWTIDGVARGFNIGYSETDAGNTNVVRYDTKTISGGVTFGIPISEFNFVNFGASYESTEINTNPLFLDPIIALFLLREGNKYDLLRLSGSYAYDTRNAAIFPDRGTLQRISLQATIPGGDLRYWKVEYDSRVFIPLINN
ncbi:MAG: outer membrane protein assembly factor BamA, partial [Gammaproteobacteria bacterium]